MLTSTPLLMLIDITLKSGSTDEKEKLLEALQERIGQKKLASQPTVGIGSTPSPDELLTAKEAAELLKVNESWLYRNWRRLPFAQKLLGGPLRFHRGGLRQWDGKERAHGAGTDLSTDVSLQAARVSKMREQEAGASGR